MPSLRALAGALLGHVERALAARTPVLERVIELSEREVLAAVTIVQNITQQSKRALAELEVLALCLSPVVAKDAPPSFGASIAQQAAAHSRFVGLCAATEAKLDKQEERAGTATISVKRILQIVAEVDAVSQRACFTTFNARIEAARMGPAGRTFDIIADELRDMTAAIQALNVDIKAIGEELMGVIPVIAKEAGELRSNHANVSSSLAKHMAEVVDSQRRTLTVLNDAVVAGRARTDGILEQSHEVMARLQFQDRIAQDLSAVLRQELASAQLLEEALLAIDAPEALDLTAIEQQARSIEAIRHGQLEEGEEDAASDAPEAGAMLMF